SNTATVSLTVVNDAPVVKIDSNGVPVVVPVVENSGQKLRLEVSFNDPDSDSWKVNVDYGDDLHVQKFPLEGPNHTFFLDLPYQQEGNYFLTVTITDDGGASGFASVPIIVFDTGVDPAQVKTVTAKPGDQAIASVSGMTVTLIRPKTDD